MTGWGSSKDLDVRGKANIDIKNSGIMWTGFVLTVGNRSTSCEQSN